MDQTKGSLEKSQRNKKRNWYASLTEEERKRYAHKTNEARKRKINDQQVERQEDDNVNEGQRSILEAQLASSGYEGTLENSQSNKKRNWYASLTEEERKRYAQKTNEARKRKRNDQQQKTNEARKGKENDQQQSQVERQAHGCILKAQLASYEYEGKICYEPICSELHILANEPCCKHCGAMRFQFEPPSFCCQNGQVKLAKIEMPEELYRLFTSNTEEAKEFCRNIRAYNSIFAFTSFGVNLDKDLASSRNGVYTFRAQGQIYHDLPSLIPNENCPRYFQLYFFDTQNELQNRLRILQDLKLNKSIVQKLMHIMEGNPYAQVLRRIKDSPSFNDFQICIRKDVKLDQRVYNEPSADQVAAIWVEGNDPSENLERDIVVHAHSGNRHRIKHYYGCYDPLQYPILLPRGEAGWHQDITKGGIGNHMNECNSAIPAFNSAQDIIDREEKEVTEHKGKNISCREYYAYKLQIRHAKKSALLFAARLLQQFVVDTYIKLETTRLDFYRMKQAQIRGELYQGIVDAVMAGETRGSEVGQRLVLPASFIGGPRDMRRRYLDALALVHHFGKPDLFITMTCNPEWKEIQENLADGQTTQDRPDLVSRVFRAKLQDFKDQLFKKDIFGKVAANVHVIEFQKRGLPHAHMLIILKPEFKITSPDQYDKFVSAELPDRHKNPHLYDLVVKHMMHGPCGQQKPNNPCMVNGECKFHYPRPYCDNSMCAKDGYPIYKKRNDKKEVVVRSSLLDNRWVVPYNPYLLTRYNCHINVEICSGIKAVKYLYKYIYKGHDRVAVYISCVDGNSLVDEIQQFQDARWVSAPEAMWRIFEFHLNEMNPAVINLQLHLPAKQFVSYWEHQDLKDVMHSDNVSKTMLTEFFKFYQNNPNAKKYLYREFPEHYVWKVKNRCWSKRLQKDVIARVNGANPAEGERYYLRVLLNHIPGPSSYEDLLTVNGNKCSTFKQAAQKRGLLESDNSISKCLNEAVAFQMPHALRRLFATILVYCHPEDTRVLWDRYFEVMCDDFRRNGQGSNNSLMSSTLQSINYYLESMGKNINQFDLPILPIDFTHYTNVYPREIEEEISIETPKADYGAESMLNPEQEDAFHRVLQKVNTGIGGIFFIDGPGGTGKTFLYRTLLAHLRSRKMIALATATSGVAAALMPGGRTAHSRFKIPLNANDSSLCSISKQSGNAELLRQAKLIIWDEAPMAKRFAIETLDRSLKDIMNNTEDFGGKVVVFGGDFRQVLPVVPRATREQTINASLVKSTLWSKMEKIYLSRNMRAIGDPDFSQFLLRVGNGEEPTIHGDMIQIPGGMIIRCEKDEDSEHKLIQNIFPSLQGNCHSAEYMTNRAILAAKNETVDMLNEKMVKEFPGTERTFKSFDEAVDDTNNYYQEEFLNSLTPNGLPPHKLILKIGCPIMLLRNLDPSNGLCNGTRMICKGFQNNVIHAEITMGDHKGKQVFLPRIPLSPAESEGYPFQFKRKQYPIRLCFAMTINKAQGQTIQHVGVYLPQPVFSHGQLYVALSRGTSMSTTKVLIKEDPSQNMPNSYTKNIVYKEVLQIQT